jgi:signal transduction histidine kinase
MNTASLTTIYFFYGLAFFAMGLAVLLELERTSELRLARSIPWLAAFGLIHGSHEWIEMFEVLGYWPNILPSNELRVVLLVASFGCLTAFGISLMSQADQANRTHAMRWSLAIIGMCLSGMGMLRFWFEPAEWIVVAGVWARYSLGVVGSVITSWALMSQGRVFARTGMARFGQDMVWAAAAFALYGIVGQVFVPATRLPPSNLINADLFLRMFGVPIQLFRSIIAVLVAITMIRALRVFETERSQLVQAAQSAALETERRVQQEMAQLNKQLQAAVNELSFLFEMSRILSATLDLAILLDQATAKITDLLPAGATMIVLDEGPTPVLVAATGFERPEYAEQIEAARSAGADVIRRARAGQAQIQFQGSILAVPLQAKQAPIGSLVVCASNIHELEGKQSLLTTLGHELGIAIANAQLYQQVQERETRRGDLLRKAVEVQEEERKRIARELHDGIGQIFTALALGLSGVEDSLTRDPELARRQTGNLKDMAIHAIAEMRHLVADLRPPQLDDLGLVPALHWLADEWRELKQLDVHVQVSGPRRRLTPEIETVLFRITQEGLTNVAKHAQAQQAVVRLAFDSDPLELCIEDNGIGMTPDLIRRRLVRHQGWGLAGIQERAALVGGEVQIDSSPGHGTRLTVHIPLGAQEATP